jgi:hypothetical protein
MSKEWLQKLAELSNDKGLIARARQAQQAAARSAPARPRRGLAGAVIRFFFRLVVLLAAFEAAVLFAVANSQGITEESLGYIFHYAVWLGLVDGLGETGLYDATVRPALEQIGDAAPFLAPLAAALAGTIYFLPSINAARIGNPIRFLVYIINLVFGWSLFGWFVALVLSLITGLGRAAPAAATPGRSAAAPASRRAPAPTRTASAAPTARNVRVPTVVRSDGRAGSWIRPR